MSLHALKYGFVWGINENSIAHMDYVFMMIYKRMCFSCFIYLFLIFGLYVW